MAESGGQERDDAPAFAHTNRFAALVVLAVTAALAIYVLTSDWAWRTARDGFALGGLPLFALAAMAGSALIVALDREALRPSGPRGVTPGQIGIVVLVAAAIGAVFFSLPWVGFVPGIWFLVVAGALALGFRPVWVAVAAGLLAAVALRVLMYLLGVGIPDGPLGALF